MVQTRLAAGLDVEVDVWTVLLAATVTAVATGFGALPFWFVRDLGRRLVGAAQAIAGGLMLGASHGLIAEGFGDSAARTLLGVVVGVLAIAVADRLVSRSELEVADLEGLDARKAVLILGVMTAHSFAEGVGVGVAFGEGRDLGLFVMAAIAVHNVPEGLAISLVLVPRGTSVTKAALWSVFSSLPQPLMAVPAYLFVLAFAPLLPIGLGLAAGAMVWMVFDELLPEALERASPATVATAATLSYAALLAFQRLVLGG